MVSVKSTDHCVTTLPLVVCATPFTKEERWRWFESSYSGRVDWEFTYQARPRRLTRRFPLRAWNNLSPCWEAVTSARARKSRLLISHDPKITFRCAVLAKALRVRVEHVAWSFNFAKLPGAPERRMMTRAFAAVDRFIVFSTMERDLYADVFGIPLRKIEMIPWGVGPPVVSSPDTPLERGDYVCAIGGNARDYATLMEAMRLLPDVRLVAVMRPENAAGLDVPENVEIRVNLPIGDANNIVKFSRLMALPLVGADVPCGHVTIVNCMYLGKALVITDSQGIRDYVTDGINGLTCDPRSPTSLARRIRELWDDPALRDRLGAAGAEFAHRSCSEESTRLHLDRVLTDFGVL